MPPLGLHWDSSDKVPEVPSIVLQAYKLGFRAYHLGWSFRERSYVTMREIFHNHEV